MELIDLNEFCGGSMREQFSSAFRKVIENCMDAGTTAEAREIDIKVRFLVGADRSTVLTGVQTKTKLAPEIPGKTIIGIGLDMKTGKLVAEEYREGVKGQSRFDPDTGEIFEDHGTQHVIQLKAGEA